MIAFTQAHFCVAYRGARLENTTRFAHPLSQCQVAHSAFNMHVSRNPERLHRLQVSGRFAHDTRPVIVRAAASPIESRSASDRDQTHEKCIDRTSLALIAFPTRAIKASGIGVRSLR
jgi:hypothetical protein